MFAKVRINKNSKCKNKRRSNLKVNLPENVFKLCLMGDGGVGKTTLCNRIITGIFNPTTKMTIGIDFQLFKTSILKPDSESPQKIDIEIQLWDFGGQQHFRFMQPRFLKGATGGLLLYDLSRFATSKNLPEWKKLWADHNDENVPLYVVGSKSDMLNKGGLDIAEENLKDFMKSLGASKYFIISSKSGYSVDVLIDSIAKDMYLYRKKYD